MLWNGKKEWKQTGSFLAQRSESTESTGRWNIYTTHITEHGTIRAYLKGIQNVESQAGHYCRLILDVTDDVLWNVVIKYVNKSVKTFMSNTISKSQNHYNTVDG